MTTDRRLAQGLPDILGDLATGPYPDYIDDILASSARVRQRPAWTFPERWLPMVDVARQPVFVARLPWRSIAMAMLVLALLLAAAFVYVGSQQRVPAPFGPARNGVIAYEAGGDIFTADAGTGATTAIVKGPEKDLGPRYSLDGRRLVFERKVNGNRGSQLYVARADGSNLTLVTPEPVVLAAGLAGRAWEKYEFSADGRTILIATAGSIGGTMTLAQSDGTGVRQLDVGMSASEPSFRPPDGAEVLFIGSQGLRRGIYAVNPTTGKVRSIKQLEAEFDLAGASWSPDGSRIAYWSWGGPGAGLNSKSHVVAADGTGDIELPSPAGAVWNAHATWSNDGTKLFIARGYTDGFNDVRGVVIPADGSNFGTEVAPAVETACCAAWMWSPDDSALLGRPAPIGIEPTQPVIIDVITGKSRLAPWTATSDPTWQRLAP
jgi:Tol biopolymer transport system component